LPANISANFMERIAIIDHALHNLFIEDIDEDMLQEKYGGEEEAYIKDNYTLHEPWSWEYITCITYYPIGGDPVDVDLPYDLKDYD